MELTQAIDNLKKDLLKKQSEVSILELAISVLENNFSADLKVLENANKTITEKQVIIEAKEVEILEKNNIILEKQAIIDSKTIDEDVIVKK